MRTKKDPNIRREAFIHAAAELFMTKGYEGVSVRDVLDAVGEKTASPSVFYYYFSSKDELYQTVVKSVAEQYVNGFAMEADPEKSLPDRIAAMIAYMGTYIRSAAGLLLPENSVPNRLFVLDMKEKVTQAIAGQFCLYLKALGLNGERSPESLAGYIAGGIGELLFAYMSSPEKDEKMARALTEDVAGMTMDLLGLDRELREQIISAAAKEGMK